MNFEDSLRKELEGVPDAEQVFDSIVKLDLLRARKETDRLISQSGGGPLNPRLRLLRAYISMGLHDHEEAICLLKELLRIDPEDYYCHYFYGICLRNLNYPWEALKYFEKARSIDDNDKVNEQIHNTQGIIKVAESKALQLVAFRIVPEKYRFMG
ncbi:hypothetical protein JW968_00025 [Candidatus Woesearchaeota archaeon]|nr:hypothetical protein [Candidatus Woesearchaeota archaeon]